MGKRNSDVRNSQLFNGLNDDSQSQYSQTSNNESIENGSQECKKDFNLFFL